MKYSLLSLALILTTTHPIQAGDCPELNSPKKSENETLNSRAEYFCDLFKDQLIEKEKGWAEQKSKCRTSVLPYFQQVEEDNESIKNFVEVCIYNKVSSVHCAEGIVHLKNLCYDMNEAAELLKLAGKSQYHYKFGYSYIKLTIADWNKLKTIEKLNISNCLVYLSADYKNRMEILQEYKYWLVSNPSSECNCIDVFGLQKIYSSRKSSGISLQDYYKEICVTNNNNKNHVWTRYQYDAIAKDSKTIENKAIVTFLTRAVPIAKANWFDSKSANTHWSFTDISRQIDLKSDSVSEQRVKLVAYALQAQLSETDYMKFVTVTSKINLDIDCRLLMLNILFNIEKYPAVNLKKYNFVRNENFYGRNQKSYFQLQLSSLVDLFAQSSHMAQGCENFVKIIKEFKEIIEDSIWGADHISRLLNTSVNTGKGIDLTLRCLSFCKQVEKSFSDIKMLPSTNSPKTEGYRLSDDFPIAFQEFREHLFKKPNQQLEIICKDEDSERNTKSDKSILNLMNYAFNGNKENLSLENLFMKATEGNFRKPQG